MVQSIDRRLGREDQYRFSANDTSLALEEKALLPSPCHIRNRLWPDVAPKANGLHKNVHGVAARGRRVILQTAPEKSRVEMEKLGLLNQA
jgi:hypothetical protein